MPRRAARAGVATAQEVVRHRRRRLGRFVASAAHAAAERARAAPPASSPFSFHEQPLEV